RPRDRARGDARAARQRVPRTFRARAAGPAPAFPGRPLAGRDRPAHRGQSDADLTTDQTVTRARAATDRALAHHANHRRAPDPREPLPTPTALAARSGSACSARPRFGKPQPVAALARLGTPPL